MGRDIAIVGGGGRGSRLRNAWNNMLQRCCNPRHPSWLRYGARGVTVCDAWMDFETFAADVGEPSAGMSLDRIDNNGGYEPANCRWVTQRTQMRNMSRNRLIAYDGRTLCVAEWADVFGMREHTMHSRLDRGWSMDRIASQPLGRRVRGRATP